MLQVLRHKYAITKLGSAPADQELVVSSAATAYQSIITSLVKAVLLVNVHSMLCLHCAVKLVNVTVQLEWVD